MQVGRRPAVVSPLELRESLRVFAAARAAPLAFVGLATARTAPHKHTHLKQQPCALRDGRRRGGHAVMRGKPATPGTTWRSSCSASRKAKQGTTAMHTGMRRWAPFRSVAHLHGPWLVALQRRGQAAFLESSCSCMGMARTDDNMDGSNA